MLMVQHPKGSPLKIAWGSLLPQSPADRVFYTIPTLNGSSGSPVFNSDLNLVALHCAGDVTGNLGVPFASILDKIGDTLAGEIPSLASGTK
jgi:V8-like Glu-specific endopeptidase